MKYPTKVPIVLSETQSNNKKLRISLKKIGYKVIKDSYCPDTNWIGEFAPNLGHDPHNPFPLKSVYASGSPRKGTTLWKELRHLQKVIKDTLKGKISSDWFNRDY